RTGGAEALDGRDGEGGRLTSTRLGASDEVLAFERDRDGAGLNRSRRGVAGARDGVEHGRAEVHLVERTDHEDRLPFSLVSSEASTWQVLQRAPGPAGGPGRKRQG